MAVMHQAPHRAGEGGDRRGGYHTVPRHLLVHGEVRSPSLNGCHCGTRMAYELIMHGPAHRILTPDSGRWTHLAAAGTSRYRCCRCTISCTRCGSRRWAPLPRRRTSRCSWAGCAWRGGDRLRLPLCRNPYPWLVPVPELRSRRDFCRHIACDGRCGLVPRRGASIGPRVRPS